MLFRSAISPFLARTRVALLNDLGAYPEGQGAKVWAEISGATGRFARFGQYVKDVLDRESFKATFDEVSARACGVVVFVSCSSERDAILGTGVRHGEVQGALWELAQPAVTRRTGRLEAVTEDCIC